VGPALAMPGMMSPFACGCQALEEREADTALELTGDDGGVEALRFVAVAEGKVGLFA